MGWHEGEGLSVVITAKAVDFQVMRSAFWSLDIKGWWVRQSQYPHGKMAKAVKQRQSREARLGDGVGHVGNQSQMGDVDWFWKASRARRVQDDTCSTVLLLWREARWIGGYLGGADTLGAPEWEASLRNDLPVPVN